MDHRVYILMASIETAVAVTVFLVGLRALRNQDAKKKFGKIIKAYPAKPTHVVIQSEFPPPTIPAA
jgi:hypothetical protein